MPRKTGRSRKRPGICWVVRWRFRLGTRSLSFLSERRFLFFGGFMLVWGVSYFWVYFFGDPPQNGFVFLLVHSLIWLGSSRAQSLERECCRCCNGVPPSVAQNVQSFYQAEKPLPAAGPPNRYLEVSLSRGTPHVFSGPCSSSKLGPNSRVPPLFFLSHGHVRFVFMEPEGLPVDCPF